MPRDDRRQRVYLDLTHVGRHVTGIERIAIELFEKVDFENADIVAVRARGLASLVLKQHLVIPLLALLNPTAQFVFPGFPPSPLMQLWRDRVIVYVHDLFLVTRRADLGLKAKLYMAWPFKRAVTRLKHFLVNSEKTRSELQPFIARDASIRLYRPPVGNVFELAPGQRRERGDRAVPLRLVALGTVEPRKNFTYAADIRDALERTGLGHVELDIIGRPGWGGDADRLAGRRGTRLRGYLAKDEASRLISQADLYLCTSHDEGLGLPLLEVQYAGLAVVAPDLPVFREVLGESGIFIPPCDADGAAAAILAALSQPDWRQRTTDLALANLRRWNDAASADAARAQVMFAKDAGVAEPAAGMTADSI